MTGLGSRLLLPLVFVGSFAASGCGGGGDSGRPAPLRIAAASDLQAVMPILAARFKLEAGVEIEPVFGSSGQLAQQIKAGAPFDLFLAANRAFVDNLAKSGEIRPDSVKTYTRGSLVLVVSHSNDPGVAGLADLVGPKVKFISIANPEFAPYGAAAKQALERAGHWDPIKGKIAYGESVRQALQQVVMGNSEVGLVGRAIATEKGVRLIPIDPDLYDPIWQGLGIVSASKRAADASAFVTFLVSPAGQGILQDFGFRSVPAE